MIGISVYPDMRPLDEIVAYMALASQYGCKRVFTSMFSVKGTKEEILAYFDEFIQHAHQHDMEVVLDVNPECFETVGARYDDLKVFADLGADILRMDFSYGIENDLILLKNPYGIRIEFNASTLPPFLLKQYIDRGISPKSIMVSHNFYPQKYTGMKWHKFNKLNKEFKELGVSLSAFITSQAKDTHGVWDAKDGLCTVERFRNLTLDLQYRILMATGTIDTLLIGNAYASEEELEIMSSNTTKIPVDKNHPLIKTLLGYGVPYDYLTNQKTLRVTLMPNTTELEKDILFNTFPHIDLGDSSEWMWRSRLSRVCGPDKNIIVRKEVMDTFERGSIVIVNNSSKRYQGEVQIVLEPMENDGTRNLVGYLDKNEILMLDVLYELEVVVFKEI